MDALISGQAGVAILIRPEGFTAFRSENPETEIATTAERLPYFLWGATDVAHLESATKETALAHLRMAEDCDTAMHLALILLDHQADPDTREAASESLGELFARDEVREFVENRLHCAVLPQDADLMGALGKVGAGGPLEDFLVHLGQRQACIKGIRAGWDALPQSVFPSGTPRRVFLTRLTDSGAFRMLVEAGEDPLKFYSAKFVCYRELEGLANLRQAVRTWLEPFQPPRQKPDAQRLADLRRADLERPLVGWESSNLRKDRRGKGRHYKGQKKEISLAHVERVGKLLDRLRKERGSPEPLLWRIDKEIEHLAEFHGQEAEDLPYYAQTLTQLALKLSERSLFDHALQCIGRAREAAPEDPYPISLAISIYSRQEDLASAEGVFVQARAAGLANEVTYNALLDAYGKAGNLAKAEEVFAQAEAAGLANEVTYNALLDAYGKAGNLGKAEEVFAQAEAAGLANEVTYNALLDAYGKAGKLAKAEEVFAQAEAAGLADEVTYGALLDAYGKADNLGKVEEVFAQAEAAGLANEVAYNALLDAYAKAGNLGKSEEVFARAEAAGLANEVTYSALLDAYAKGGNLAKAEEVFTQAEAARLADEVTYGALLDAYGKAGNLAKAEEVFAQAEAAGLADEVTYGALLDAYGKAGNLAKAEEVFAQAEAAGLANEATYNALLDAYGKAGNLAKAEEVFAQAEAAGLANEVTYGALVDAYGKAGKLAKAEEVFAQAEAAGLANEVTYNALLDAYGKAGKLAKAEEVFARAEAAGLANIVTYGTLLDAYARSHESARLLSTFRQAIGQGLRLIPLDKAVLATTLLKGLYAVGREDEFFGVIPTDFLSQELLLFYARLHHRPIVALSNLQSFADISSPAQLVCRYRLASPGYTGEKGGVQAIKSEILAMVERPAEVSLFSRVALTDTLARCHRLEGDLREMYRAWEHVADGMLDSTSRVAYYAGHGRDSVIWGLQNDKTVGENLRLVLQGSNELLTALSLSRASGTMSPGRAATYGDVVAGMTEVRRGLDFLPHSKRSNILASLRSRTSISVWQQPLQSVTEIPPNVIQDAVSGQRAVLDMLQMV